MSTNKLADFEGGGKTDLTLEPLGDVIDQTIGVSEIVEGTQLDSSRVLDRGEFIKESGKNIIGFEMSTEINFDTSFILDPDPGSEGTEELYLTANLTQDFPANTDIGEEAVQEAFSPQEIHAHVRTDGVDRLRRKITDNIDDPILKYRLTNNWLTSAFDDLPNKIEFEGGQDADWEETQSDQVRIPYTPLVVPDRDIITDQIQQLDPIIIDFELQPQGFLSKNAQRFLSDPPTATLEIEPIDLVLTTSIDCLDLNSKLVDYKERLQDLESEARVGGKSLEDDLRSSAQKVVERLDGASSVEDAISGFFSDPSLESQDSKSFIQSIIEDVEPKIAEAKTKVDQLSNLEQRFDEFGSNWENFVSEICLNDLRPEIEDAPYSQIEQFISGERAGPSASELKSDLQTLIEFFNEAEGILDVNIGFNVCDYENDVPRELRNEIAQFKEDARDQDETSKAEVLRDLVDEGEDTLSDVEYNLGQGDPCYYETRERVESELDRLDGLLDRILKECVRSRDIDQDIRGGLEQIKGEAEDANKENWTVDRVEDSIEDANGLLEDFRDSTDRDNPCYRQIEEEIQNAISDLENEVELSCADVDSGLERKVSSYESKIDRLANTVRSDIRERLDSKGSSLIEEIEKEVENNNPCKQDLISKVESARSELLRRNSVDTGDQPCREQYSSLDEDISELERDVAGIPRASVTQGGTVNFAGSSYGSVNQIFSEIESISNRMVSEIDNTGCLREFTSRLNALGNNAEQLMLGVRVDQEAVDEIRSRRQDIVSKVRERSQEIGDINLPEVPGQD